MEGVRVTDTTPVVVEAVRTPMAKEGGVFADIRSEDLSLPLVNDILVSTSLTGEDVDDLMWGCAKQREEQGNNLARLIALLSDLGESVPATTINRWDASSAQAIAGAADAIRAGQRDVIIAGGVENLTRAGFGTDKEYVPHRLGDIYLPGKLQRGETAENVVDEYGISREEQDQYAYRSHQRAIEATDSGRFADEIVVMQTEDGRIEEDESIRRDLSPDKLAQFPPVLQGNGTVTAGNAPHLGDGAAATLITSRTFAADRDLDVLAAIGSHTVAGVNPTMAGTGPIPAVRGLLKRTGHTIEDYDLVELNEAFASQALHCQRELGIDDERLNINGGAIAIGHALGACGARLAVTLVHEMKRREVERGLVTMSVGFGQGMAIELERKSA